MNQEQLDGIQHELNTQDNRITADPIFCVFEKIRIYGMDDGYASDFLWSDPENRETYFEEDEISEEEAEAKGYERVYYVEIDQFVNAHFTENAANRHIKINGHNLQRPFTYVTSLWRCQEMIDIRNALKNGELVVK